jgi:hypothetical protein
LVAGSNWTRVTKIFLMKRERKPLLSTTKLTWWVPVGALCTSMSQLSRRAPPPSRRGMKYVCGVTTIAGCETLSTLICACVKAAPPVWRKWALSR